MKTQKTFKAFKTGRVYDVEQVLYYSIEVTGHDQLGDVVTVVMCDPSRHLMYMFENHSFVESGADVLKLYDGMNNSHLSVDSDNYKDLERFFGLEEIQHAVHAIKSARYEMNCSHEANDRAHELSLEISDIEAFIDGRFEGKSLFGESNGSRVEPSTSF